VIHIHGTEQDYGLIAGWDPSKIIISIQGLLGPYSKAYWGNLNYWQRFMFPSLIKAHAGLKARARVEDTIFQKNINYGGRTIWDKAHVSNAQPQSNYYYLPELMRPCFFTRQWRLDESETLRIYTTSTPRPYKGTDVLIDAVAILKNKYPNISLRIGGPFGDRPFSWSRALRRKVRNLSLQDNVEFIGFLSDNEILSELLRARVYVLPSFIENSPNSLAEAQIAGVPCVATAMGGVLSMLEHEKTGLLTNVGDPAVMAESIDRILSDDELASTLGGKAMQEARLRHNPQHAVECYLETYSKMSCNETN
jgi:glycosyltransferase involved in cell wall biosynthesis